MSKPALKKNPDFPGEYLTRDGWRVYKSDDDSRWHIINPETGGDFDSADTLRAIREQYA